MAERKDINVVKKNIKSMIFQDAPEVDIDAYIGSEGYSLDEIRGTRTTITKEDIRKSAAEDYVNKAINNRQATNINPAHLMKQFVDDTTANKLSVGGINVPGETVSKGVGRLAMDTMSGLLERGQGAVANPILSKMMGDGKILEPMMQGLKGEKLGKVGDILSLKGFDKVNPMLLEAGARTTDLIAEGAAIGAAGKIGKFALAPKAPKLSAVQKIKMQKLGVDKAAIIEKQALSERVSAAKKTIEGNLKTLSDALNKGVIDTVKKAKNTYKDFSEAFSKNYQQALDDITESLAGNPVGKSGTKFGNKSAVDWMKKTIKDIAENNPELRDTKAFKALNTYKNNLAKTKKEISFKRLNAEIRKIRSRDYQKAYNSMDDVASDKIRHSFGDFIDDFTDDFRELQDKSASVINSKKVAAEYLNPNREAKIIKAEKVLRRKALGKATSEDQVVLDEMKKVLGDDFDSVIDDIGKQIRGEQTKLSDIKLSGREGKAKIQTDAQLRKNELAQKEILAKAKEGKKKGLLIGGAIGLAGGVGWAARELLRAAIYKKIFKDMLGG